VRKDSDKLQCVREKWKAHLERRDSQYISPFSVCNFHTMTTGAACLGSYGGVRAFCWGIDWPVRVGTMSSPKGVQAPTSAFCTPVLLTLHLQNTSTSWLAGFGKSEGGVLSHLSTGHDSMAPFEFAVGLRRFTYLTLAIKASPAHLAHSSLK